MTWLLLALQVAPPVLVEPVAQTTTQGSVLLIIYGVVALALTAVAAAVTKVLLDKSKANQAFAVVNHFWLLAQTIASHVSTKLKPDIQAALADGTVSTAELSALKAEAVAALKEAAGDSWMGELKALFGDGNVTAFLSGLVAKALTSSTASPAAPALTKLTTASHALTTAASVLTTASAALTGAFGTPAATSSETASPR